MLLTTLLVISLVNSLHRQKEHFMNQCIVCVLLEKVSEKANLHCVEIGNCADYLDSEEKGALKGMFAIECSIVKKLGFHNLLKRRTQINTIVAVWVLKMSTSISKIYYELT